MPDVPQLNIRRDFGKYTPHKQEKNNSIYWRPGPKKKKQWNQKKWDNYQKYKTIENDTAIAEQLRWIKDDQ